jgi:hypothetical protein
VVGALITFQLWKARKRSRQRGRTGTPQLVFDLAAGVLRDPGGATIAPLAHVRLVRTFQLGSSSKGLAAQYPGGEHVFARGTPFGDSVDEVEHALRSRYSFSS